MDAFHHENLVILQSQLFPALLALAGLEVISRQFHFLPSQQCVHLLVEQWDIQRLHMLEVIVAALVHRSLFAVNEVIIKRYAHRLDAVGEQLY